MKTFNIFLSGKRNALLVLALSLVIFPACKKLVEIPPAGNSINAENVFAQDKTAAATVNAIYTDLTTREAFQADNLPTFMNIYASIMADELSLDISLYDTPANWYRNNLTAASDGSKPWQTAYQAVIYRANACIEGLSGATTLSAGVKTQLTGEAYFLRAFAYFYLTNLYGDVPLLTSTDYEQNALLARTAQQEVYAQIISDLKTAKSMLADDYIGVDGKTITTSRITPNKAAAEALLARVYLYTGNTSQAEAEATNVISQTSRYSLIAPNDVFLMNSQEAIWQLQPTTLGYNTQEARTFIIPSTGPDADHAYQVSPLLLNAYEAGDLRKAAWIGQLTIGALTYYYPNKYKSALPGAPVTEYEMVMRLAEQYLIRAEARTVANNLSDAQADLNTVRSRAGLPNTTASTQADLLTAIAHERRVELFTEWGDRWLNLKRTKTIDAVMPAVATVKGSTWKSYAQLVPIPARDLQLDHNLKQNPGY